MSDRFSRKSREDISVPLFIVALASACVTHVYKFPPVRIQYEAVSEMNLEFMKKHHRVNTCKFSKRFVSNCQRRCPPSIEFILTIFCFL